MPTFNRGDITLNLIIEDLLGVGLHGEVYAARHRFTGEGFALKVTHLSDRQNAGAVRRALAAAKGTYSIDHANVVKVFDLGCEGDGMVWIRMELLQGCTISTLLAWQGRLSPRMALSVAYEAAWGLAAAHEAQIVHRDVKPGNLFLVNAGPARTAVKVLDFSVAKVLPSSLETTLGRGALGTLGYMPGEQIYGAPAHPCFDIYALGMTLWQMLAGVHPFQADLQDMRALIAKQLLDVPPSLVQAAGLPPRIDDLVRRAVEKDASRRYPSMIAFARAIDEARAWLSAEIAAGRFPAYRPSGEPAIPAVSPAQAYFAPMPVRAAEPGPAPPEARVILPAQGPKVGLGGTIPLGESGLFGLVPPRDAMLPSPPLPSPDDRKERR